MATKTKQKKTTKEKSNLKVVHSANKTTPSYNGKVPRIPLDQIDFSPFNEREYSEDELQLFAKEIDRNEVQVPIMVRPMNGRYELVYGERRTRASRIAERNDIPAIIRKGLTDEEVIIIQILENLDREDPHPMDIAKSFNQLKGRGFSEREIAARLGRSKSFVISRLKLMLLTQEWQQIFRLNKMTTFEAFEVASLSPESQNDLFKTLCKNWREKQFKLRNLNYYIGRFKYELHRAPFDIKDKTLSPEAGSCIGCPHNSATFRTLFSEYSKDGHCSKTECFQSKCTKHLLSQTTKVLQEEKPEVLIFNGTPQEFLIETIQQIEGIDQLQQLDMNAITILEAPEEPNKENYMYGKEFDDDGYKEAVEEYNEENEEYEKQKVHSKKGMLIDEGVPKAVWFLPERKINTYANTSTAKGTVKEIQTALKSGTATTSLLEAGIERVESSIRQIEAVLRQNTQNEIYNQFQTKVEEEGVQCIPTEADQAIMRFMIYQSLDYSSREKVDRVLFPDISEEDDISDEKKYEAFFHMNSETESFLIRTLSLFKPDSKYPSSDLSYFFNKAAESAGINVGDIEKQEQEKGNERKQKKNQKILELRKAIEKIDKKDVIESKERTQAAA